MNSVVNDKFYISICFFKNHHCLDINKYNFMNRLANCCNSMNVKENKEKQIANIPHEMKLMQL